MDPRPRGDDIPFTDVLAKAGIRLAFHGHEMDRSFAGMTLPMPSFPRRRESIGFLHGRKMDRRFRRDDVFRGLDLIRMRRRREMRLR
jgi:hypothetical protein